MGAYDRNTTVHALFAHQAGLSPQAIAIVKGEAAGERRYGDLEASAADLARVIAASGVKRGDRVALLCGRSADAIIAMLAVMKCGAAFVPLDPSYPPARLALMLAEAAPALVLRERGLRMPEGVGDTPVLDLSATLDAAVRMPDLLSELPTPDVQVTAEDAAYVMFTSGSTGKPKGVVVPHRAIVRLVRDQSYARFAPDEVFLHLAPLAFDASTFEIWGALLNGARLAIIPEARPALDDILDALQRHQVTVAWFTAGLFHALIDHRVSGLAPLKRLLAGGDVLSPAHVARIRAALPHCQIVNGYGPTENTTFSCCHEVTDAEISAMPIGAIPVGACITHSTAWVADDDLEPVADGQPGQLVVGGDGLAIGYLNAPELTAGKFVIAPATGERVYLTGDIAVRRPDGVFAFHGRADRQIKIDGKRVEPGDIEAALRDCVGVADAAVIFWGSEGAPKRLLAWIVADVQTPPPQVGPAQASPHQVAASLPDQVRRALEIALPGHMRPARIMLLHALPLTDNGKLDRKRLEELALQDLALEELQRLDQQRQNMQRLALAADSAVSAAGEGAAAVMLRESADAAHVRAIVSGAWAEALGMAAPPQDVSFFDLGGTSLLLMRVHARIGAAGAPVLPVLAFFAHPTINALVAKMTGANAETGALAGSAIRVDALSARREALGRMRARAGGKT